MSYDDDYDYDREEIIAANPILDYCRARGWEPRRVGREWKILCPLHKERTPSFCINSDKQIFNCFGCGAAGSVIDLHMGLHGISKGEAMRELSPGGGKESNSTTNAKSKSMNTKRSPDPASFREVAAYDYQDPTGRVRFQVVRYEPKDFRQCQIVDGKRVWNMDGVERLPYRLPEVLIDGVEVWIVEGGKDVETLRDANQRATCNPGGAGKWLPAFSQ